MSISIWTDDRVDMVKNLWEAGLSASQIAVEIGGSPFYLNVSRNSVIGIVHRRGWGGRTKGHKAPAAPRQRKVKPAQFAGRARPLRGDNFKAATLSPESAVDTFEQEYESCIEISAAEAACSLFELNEATCHWPIGDPQQPDFHFCGGLTLEGSPYCGSHHRVAHQPAAPRRLSPEEHMRRVARGRALSKANRERGATGG